MGYTPTKMENIMNGGDDLDYVYQCTANLGPCNYDICQDACCIKLCNNYYSGLHPRPMCEDVGPRYKYKLCICWHDCYKN